MSPSVKHYHPNLYYDRITAIPEPISNVFEQYSGIARNEQLEHVKRVRDQAYPTHPYPCLGRFRFLELELSQHDLYQSYVVPTLKETVPEGKEPPLFLDLGTCLGQDVRKLIYDGIPVSRLYGGDIEQNFIDTGYKLFLDEDKLPRDHFLCPANVFEDPTDNELGVLKDKVDILNVSAVFHLFSRAQQIDVARCCMRLLHKTPGSRSLVLGAHVGNINPVETGAYTGGKKFRHNEETWKALWEEICQEPEFHDKVQKLEVKSSLKSQNWRSRVIRAAVPDGQASQEENTAPRKDGADIEEGFRWMRFEVWITF